MAVVTQLSSELLLLMMTMSACLLPSKMTRLFVFQVLRLSFAIIIIILIILIITIIINIIIIIIIVVFYFQFLYYNFSFQIWDIINQCRS